MDIKGFKFPVACKKGFEWKDKSRIKYSNYLYIPRKAFDDSSPLEIDNLPDLTYRSIKL